MTLEHGWVEKRQFERVAAILKVDYSKISKQELDENLHQSAYSSSTIDKIPQLAKKSPVVSAVTRDVSEGGLALISKEKFEKADDIVVYLYLPEVPAPLTILMEVAHSVISPDGFRSGLKILAINNDDIKKLDKYLLIQRMGRRDESKKQE